jgi:hypothetical protein
METPQIAQAPQVGHNYLNRAATLAAVTVLALGAKAATLVAPAHADTGSDPTALCEADALSSFTGGQLSIDTSNNFAVQEVSASALPDSCNGLVWRTVSTEELAGPDTSDLTPNTANTDVQDGNGAFDTTIQAPMNTSWTCGQVVEQAVTMFVTPVQAGSPDSSETQVINGEPGETDCPPAATSPTTPTGNPTPAPTNTAGGNTPPSPAPSPAQLVEQCETAAVDSFDGSSLKYLRPTHGKYNRVEQIVRAKAVPADCDPVVDRTISVETLVGKKGHLKPDTSLEVLDNRNIKLFEYLKQTLQQAWRPGQHTGQVVKFTATPTAAYANDGVAPLTKTF